MEEYWAMTTSVYGGWVSGLGRKKVRYFRKHRAGSMNGLIFVFTKADTCLMRTTDSDLSLSTSNLIVKCGQA